MFDRHNSSISGGGGGVNYRAWHTRLFYTNVLSGATNCSINRERNRGERRFFHDLGTPSLPLEFNWNNKNTRDAHLSTTMFRS